MIEALLQTPWRSGCPSAVRGAVQRGFWPAALAWSRTTVIIVPSASFVRMVSSLSRAQRHERAVRLLLPWNYTAERPGSSRTPHRLWPSRYDRSHETEHWSIYFGSIHSAIRTSSRRCADSCCGRRPGRVRAPPSEYDEHGRTEEVLCGHARRHRDQDRFWRPAAGDHQVPECADVFPSDAGAHGRLDRHD